MYGTYHSFLRTSALTLALVLVFQSGLLIDSTKHLSFVTGEYLTGAIGMSASVQPTKLNQYTAELTQKERELEIREEALKAREIEIGLRSGIDSGSEKTTYILSALLFILLMLITLNYVLDYLRYREKQTV